MSGQASDRKVGVISREFKRDVYENEKDLAFAKSSSCLAYYFRRSALRIFPLTPRIIGFAREQNDLLILWWSWRESNPCPRIVPHPRVYSLAIRLIRQHACRLACRILNMSEDFGGSLTDLQEPLPVSFTQLLLNGQYSNRVAATRQASSGSESKACAIVVSV